jgi:hypothetical protein
VQALDLADRDTSLLDVEDEGERSPAAGLGRRRHGGEHTSVFAAAQANGTEFAVADGPAWEFGSAEATPGAVRLGVHLFCEHLGVAHAPFDLQVEGGESPHDSDQLLVAEFAVHRDTAAACGLRVCSARRVAAASSARSSWSGGSTVRDTWPTRCCRAMNRSMSPRIQPAMQPWPPAQNGRAS